MRYRKPQHLDLMDRRTWLKNDNRSATGFCSIAILSYPMDRIADADKQKRGSVIVRGLLCFMREHGQLIHLWIRVRRFSSLTRSEASLSAWISDSKHAMSKPRMNPHLIIPNQRLQKKYQGNISHWLQDWLEVVQRYWMGNQGSVAPTSIWWRSEQTIGRFHLRLMFHIPFIHLQNKNRDVAITEPRALSDQIFLTCRRRHFSVTEAALGWVVALGWPSEIVRTRGQNVSDHLSRSTIFDGGTHGAVNRKQWSKLTYGDTQSNPGECTECTSTMVRGGEGKSRKNIHE